MSRVLPDDDFLKVGYVLHDRAGPDAVCLMARPSGPFVWVGGRHRASYLSKVFLDTAKITHIVPCKIFKQPVGYERDIKVVSRGANLFDTDRPDSIMHDTLNMLTVLSLEAAQAKSHGTTFGVLFLCEAGRHRSFAMAILFLWYISKSTKSLSEVISEYIGVARGRFELSKRNLTDSSGRVRVATYDTLVTFEQWFLNSLPAGFLRMGS